VSQDGKLLEFFLKIELFPVSGKQNYPMLLAGRRFLQRGFRSVYVKYEVVPREWIVYREQGAGFDPIFLTGSSRLQAMDRRRQMESTISTPT
jgi:hypothetical protein